MGLSFHCECIFKLNAIKSLQNICIDIVWAKSWILFIKNWKKQKMQRDNELQTETVNFIDIKMLKWCSMSFVVNNLIDAFILFAFFNGWLLLKMCQEENVFLFRFKIVPITYHQFVTSSWKLCFNGDKFELRTKQCHFSDAIATIITSTIASRAQTHTYTHICLYRKWNGERKVNQYKNKSDEANEVNWNHRPEWI